MSKGPALTFFVCQGTLTCFFIRQRILVYVVVCVCHLVGVPVITRFVDFLRVRVRGEVKFPLLLIDVDCLLSEGGGFAMPPSPV